MNRYIRSRNGSMLLYTMVVMFLIMILLLSLTAARINLKNAKASWENAPVTKQEVINDFKVDIDNYKNFSLIEGTTLVNEYQGYRYTAEITPTGNRTSKEIKDVYDLVWTGGTGFNSTPKLSEIKLTSNHTNQVIKFSGKSDTGYIAIPNHIKNLGPTEANFVNHGEQIVPITGATKARYRINEGDFTYVDGYPTTISLTGISANMGDYVTIEYLDNSNNLVAWSRYMKDNPEPSDVDLWLDVKLPNSPVMINSKQNQNGTVIGTDLIDSYKVSNSFGFTYTQTPVCLTWRSYGMGYSNYATYNNSQKKTALQYAGSPCAKMDTQSVTMVSNDLKTQVVAENQPWVNGYHTVPSNTWSKIRTYWNNPPNKPAGYSVPNDANVFNNKLYCSDPDVVNEMIRQTQHAVDKYSQHFYSQLEKYIQDIEKAYEEGTEYPKWEDYAPPEFDISTVKKVPCISGVQRNTLLSQYEKDLFNRTQLDINVLNNLTSDYKITIESRTDIPRVDANLDVYYYVNGQAYKLAEKDYYIATDSADRTNATFSLVQQLPRNLDYTDMSVINSDDVIKSQVQPMKFEFLSDNVIIEKITIEYEQLDTAEFKLQIKDPTGQVVHEELIEIKNKY